VKMNVVVHNGRGWCTQKKMRLGWDIVQQ